jgi:cell division protein FtsA
MPRLNILRQRDEYYKHFSALDIGTELVKSLVIEQDAGDGVVIGVGREPQAPSAMSGGAITDIEAVLNACNRAMEAAEDMAGTIPGRVVVGVAGELVKGFSSSISYPRDRPTQKVRQAELKNLLQLVERRALREAQHLLELERSYGDLEARLVHSAITKVRVDGYPVQNPIGFQGKTLEVTVFNTFAPITQIGAIETVIRELDLELVGAVAQPYALARAAAGDEAWEQGGIFVDIGGGTTDIALLRDGGVEGTRMFNLGGRAFTRRLSAALGLSFEEAEARKLRHSEGLLPPEHEQQLTQLLAADVDVLLQGLALSLKELARGERLPSNIYVCGGGSLLPEVMTELRKNAWAEGLPFAREPRARQLMPADVRALEDSTGQLTTPQDVAPMGLAVHALRQGAEDREFVNSVMHGVLKAMKV